MSGSQGPTVTLTDTVTRRDQRISPLTGGAVVEPTVRLVGPQFGSNLAIGGTASDNFWSYSANGSGNVTTVNAAAVLVGGATNVSYAQIASLRSARFLTSAPNTFRSFLTIAPATTANTTIYVGALSLTNGAPSNGFCFSVSNGTVSVQSYFNSVALNNVSSGFNGYLGSTYTLSSANVHRYEILYSLTTAYFFIDNYLLHSMSASTQALSPIINLPIGISVVNGSTPANVTVSVWGAYIYRMGKEDSRPQYTYIANAATTTCKNGAGTLHTIIIGAPVAGTITLYDNTTNSSPIMFNMDTAVSDPPLAYEINMDFQTGLTVTTTGNQNLTLIYE